MPRLAKLNFVGALAFSATAMMAATSAQAALVASWSFNNTLAADQSGAPALTAIDPLGNNAFITDTVNGVEQQVYRFAGNTAGNSSAAQQGGLAVSTAGLITGNVYSVDIVFQFDSDQYSWESIFGVSNRTSDYAFYVNPNNYLQAYAASPSGTTPFTFGDYHQVTLTNQGDGTLSGYLDGVLQFTTVNTALNFDTFNVANPEHLIHFFVDNGSEYANGRVAQIGIFDTVLTAAEISNLSYGGNGGGNNSDVPEPSILGLLGLGLVGLGATRRRLQGKKAA
jgi:hypothetical protein